MQASTPGARIAPLGLDLTQQEPIPARGVHAALARVAEELVARKPAGPDSVVHFTKGGAEASDLALVMAQSFTREIDMLALRYACRGATIGAQSLTRISALRHRCT